MKLVLASVASVATLLTACGQVKSPIRPASDDGGADSAEDASAEDDPTADADSGSSASSTDASVEDGGSDESEQESDAGPADASTHFDAGKGDAAATDAADAEPEAVDLPVLDAPATRPLIDLVFTVDNSGSVVGEVTAMAPVVQQSLVAAFSGVDVRVIAISAYGEVGESVRSVETGLCLASPLGTHDCSDPSTQPPSAGPLFYHFDENVDGTALACVVLESYAAASVSAEQFGPDFAEGWQAFLRETAEKHLVVFSDDGIACSTDTTQLNAVADADAVANTFDGSFLALSEAQFGTVERRNYVVHSIIGQAVPAGAALLPEDPIADMECTDNGTNVEGPGLEYQALSRLTGGLRLPICDPSSSERLFQAIASSASCRLQAPEALDGLAPVDPRDATATLTEVAGAAACDGGDWYSSPTHPDSIQLCPTTCAALGAPAELSVTRL